jgi:hypothetical protein
MPADAISRTGFLLVAAGRMDNLVGGQSSFENFALDEKSCSAIPIEPFPGAAAASALSPSIGACRRGSQRQRGVTAALKM